MNKNILEEEIKLKINLILKSLDNIYLEGKQIEEDCTSNINKINLFISNLNSEYSNSIKNKLDHDCKKLCIDYKANINQIIIYLKIILKEIRFPKNRNPIHLFSNINNYETITYGLRNNLNPLIKYLNKRNKIKNIYNSREIESIEQVKTIFSQVKEFILDYLIHIERKINNLTSQKETLIEQYIELNSFKLDLNSPLEANFRISELISKGKTLELIIDTNFLIALQKMRKLRNVDNYDIIFPQNITIILPQKVIEEYTNGEIGGIKKMLGIGRKERKKNFLLIEYLRTLNNIQIVNFQYPSKVLVETTLDYTNLVPKIQVPPVNSADIQICTYFRLLNNNPMGKLIILATGDKDIFVYGYYKSIVLGNCFINRDDWTFKINKNNRNY